MPTKLREKIDISMGSFLKFFAVAILLAIAYLLLRVFAALLLAVVIVSAVEPLIRWGQRHRISRLVMVIIIYLVAALALISLLYLVLPAIAGELQNFFSAYPIYQRELFREIETISGIPLYSFFSASSQQLLVSVPQQLTDLTQSTLQLTVNVFGGFLLAIITVVISFYLAAQEKGIDDFIRLVSPLEYEEYAIDLWVRAQQKMGQWLRAQILLGLIVGVLVYIALTLFGMRFSLVFAILAAILEIVPVIGPILAAVPAVVIGFVQSPLLGLILIATYFIIQQTESNLIVPAVMRRVVGLNPLVVMIALLVGGTLGGIIGILLAVPVASVVVEFLTDTDRKKRGMFQYGGGG